jgi:hypothetical protein
MEPGVDQKRSERMSYKDLGSKNMPPRTETPEQVELRARAAAKHRAKEEKAGKRQEQHRAGREHPSPGGAGRREPTE